jgi:hypothetical protein
MNSSVRFIECNHGVCSVQWAYRAHETEPSVHDSLQSAGRHPDVMVDDLEHDFVLARTEARSPASNEKRSIPSSGSTTAISSVTRAPVSSSQSAMNFGIPRRSEQMRRADISHVASW